MVGVDMKSLPLQEWKLQVMPPKSGAKITMTAEVSNENVPYEARVRIVYDDESQRVVTDNGVWKGVSVGRFKTHVGETYPL